jgi:hypothetical protein
VFFAIAIFMPALVAGAAWILLPAIRRREVFLRLAISSVLVVLALIVMHYLVPARAHP